MWMRLDPTLRADEPLYKGGFDPGPRILQWWAFGKQGGHEALKSQDDLN